MKNVIIYIVVCLFTCNSLFSQDRKSEFNKTLTSSNFFSYKKMQNLSRKANSYDFMALGYFVNANNNMYLKTKEIKYLEYNLEIIKPILIENSASLYSKNKWIMTAPKNNQNASSNGKEHLISEGYFFRYLGEFFEIISDNNLFIENQKAILNGLKYSYNKWERNSIKIYGDYSQFFHLRIHTGANWAIVAMYLRKFDSVNSAKYSKLINLFDSQLKKALVVKTENGIKYYFWNSSYPERFNNYLKNKVKSYPPHIQDVSHGNHVVLYLIKSQELRNPNWNGFNFSYLVNTLKLKILKKNGIAEFIDGSGPSGWSTNGWKLSDGWMKLIYFDRTLEPILREKLIPYQRKIKNSSLELQFQSIYL